MSNILPFPRQQLARIDTFIFIANVVILHTVSLGLITLFLWVGSPRGFAYLLCLAVLFLVFKHIRHILQVLATPPGGNGEAIAAPAIMVTMTAAFLTLLVFCTTFPLMIRIEWMLILQVFTIPNICWMVRIFFTYPKRK